MCLCVGIHVHVHCTTHAAGRHPPTPQAHTKSAPPLPPLHPPHTPPNKQTLQVRRGAAPSSARTSPPCGTRQQQQQQACRSPAAAAASRPWVRTRPRFCAPRQRRCWSGRGSCLSGKCRGATQQMHAGCRRCVAWCFCWGVRGLFPLGRRAGRGAAQDSSAADTRWLTQVWRLVGLLLLAAFLHPLQPTAHPLALAFPLAALPPTRAAVC